jgi:hypothetical protein
VPGGDQDLAGDHGARHRPWERPCGVLNPIAAGHGRHETVYA